MPLKIENNNYFETPPEVAVLKDDDESLVQKYLTLSLKFLTRQLSWTILLGQREYYVITYITRSSVWSPLSFVHWCSVWGDFWA